ncbi:MAG: hypothetical protein HN350_02780 [Phycisphaerales bacterium]|nr:hypothetical protein [Phycisphaerales bacterium]
MKYMKYTQKLCLMLLGLFVACQVSCTSAGPGKLVELARPAPESTKPVIRTGATIKEAMSIARAKAKSGEYDFIIDNMLSEECINDVIRKFGKDKWREKIKQEGLKRLPYYYGWMKNPSARTFGDKTILTGQHGCYAEYVKVGDAYLIVDFGQRLTSM